MVKGQKKNTHRKDNWSLSISSVCGTSVFLLTCLQIKIKQKNAGVQVVWRRIIKNVQHMSRYSKKKCCSGAVPTVCLFLGALYSYSGRTSVASNLAVSRLPGFLLLHRQKCERVERQCSWHGSSLPGTPQHIGVCADTLR